jgi:uncharacterized protein
MKRFKLSLVFLVFLAVPVLAATLHFPTLAGRIVDDARILSPATVQSLDQTLADYEHTTTNQLVVVTVPTLQGVPIEQYGYQLGRSWGIGQKGKDNGVLLIVAPKEHKVRIEVGYGLEAILTDAMTSQIIQGIILPDFRAHQMEKGVTDGVQAIIDVSGGKATASTLPKTSAEAPDQGGWSFIIMSIFVLIIFYFMVRRLPAPVVAGLLYSGSGMRSGFGGGFGGGFSGGGGSFGGGGASGGW